MKEIDENEKSLKRRKTRRWKQDSGQKVLQSLRMNKQAKSCFKDT